MTEVVLDASVVLKWFRRTNEPYVQEALRLREAYAAGALAVYVPRLLHLEIVNVAGRRWGMHPTGLDRLASALVRLRFVLDEPDLRRVGAWTARGLTAYDAAYVALAESRGISLVTADERIIQVAVGVGVPIGQFGRGASEP